MISTRTLGRVGHQTSLAVLGAAAFWAAEQDVVDQSVEQALAAGVTQVDVAPQYGLAEQRLSRWAPELEGRGVLISEKTMERTADGARAELERSLSLLGLSRFRVYQLHAVTTVDELDAAMPALAAIGRARDEGLVDHIGITGHGHLAPRVMVEALARFDFATLMFPVNPRQWSDAEYREPAERALDLAQERDVAVLAIKAAARGPRSESTDATTWYAPYTEPEDIAAGARFALSVPGVTGFCTPGDVRLLPIALDAAADYGSMDAAEREALIAARASDETIFPTAAAG